MSSPYESAFDFGMKLLWVQGELRDARKKIEELEKENRELRRKRDIAVDALTLLRDAILGHITVEGLRKKVEFLTTQCKEGIV